MYNTQIYIIYMEGLIVFNEINTIPGFTEHSRFPGMMKAAGILFSQILDTIPFK